MKRTAPVVEFPGVTEPAQRALVDRLKATLGFVTSLLSIALVCEFGGINIVGAGGGTAVAGSRNLVDLEDCQIDEVRIVIDGSHNTAFQSVAVVRDVTAALDLCQVNVPAVLGVVGGEWTKIATAAAGDHRLELRIIGNGADVTTLYSAQLQARSLSVL